MTLELGLQWIGLEECVAEAESPPAASYSPDERFSLDDNMFIEGDNLDALKLLMPTHQGQVKMIYIDPPYNTGKKKAYKDNYTSHALWLGMMCPRLYLARKLLSEDGVIFISIDDHEQANLKALCDLVFGEKNFIATIIWEKIHTRKNSTKSFSYSHEYILVYAKHINNWTRFLIPRESQKGFKNPDNDKRGLWKLDPLYANNFYAADYDITKPNGITISRPKGKYWRYSESRVKEFIDQDKIIWGDGSSLPMRKRFLSEVQDGLVPVTLFDREFAGDNAYASREVSKIFGVDKIVDYPKPTKLIQRLMQTSIDRQDIVLDFFAGSATTADAVMQLNAEDGGNRKYIMVQLPELCNEKSEAFKAGYRTIADIGKERIRRAAKKIKQDHPQCTQDMSFKEYKVICEA